MESEWTNVEFNVAYANTLNENRVRLIVIKYGEIDVENASDEVKTYLISNTYIEYGTKWFWEQLMYALAHKRGKSGAAHTTNGDIAINMEEIKVS